MITRGGFNTRSLAEDRISRLRAFDKIAMKDKIYQVREENYPDREGNIILGRKLYRVIEIEE